MNSVAHTKNQMSIVVLPFIRNPQNTHKLIIVIIIIIIARLEGLPKWGVMRRFVDTNHISREYKSKSGLVSFCIPHSLPLSCTPTPAFFAPPKDEVIITSLKLGAPPLRFLHSKAGDPPQVCLYHARRVVNHVFGNGHHVGPECMGPM